jgi:hypothetical protein
MKNNNGAESMEMDEFERRISARLVESAESLNGRTRSALARARHAALEQLPRHRLSTQHALWRVWMPTGVLATALVVTFLITEHTLPSRSRPAPPLVGASDDFSLFSDPDAFDLSNDLDMNLSDGLDLEFYEWAAGNVASAGAPTSG